MRAGGALMERAGRRGGKGALRWSWDYLRSMLGNTTEVVPGNLLTAMGNTRLGEIWSHKSLTQVIRCLKVSLFSPRNQIASLLKMEQLWMLQEGGEARNTFTLPWHASLPSASRLMHPLCSIQPAVPEAEAVLNFPPPAGTGKQIKAYPPRSALCPCGVGKGSGIGAASLPCWGSPEVVQRSETAVPFLSCITACIVFLGTVHPWHLDLQTVK